MYPELAKVAALIGDRARASMLFALLGGREMPASELAILSRCSPQSASSHFKKLVDGGLLSARYAGRQRLFRLASREVAYAIETLASIAPVGLTTSLSAHNAMDRLREARSCYDHVAGRLGVRLTDALVRRHFIAVQNTDAFRISVAGKRFFDTVGFDIAPLHAGRRSVARPCLDWTERRHHLAGSLGAALLDHFLASRWVRRHPTDRSLTVTADGRQALERWFDLRFDAEKMLP